jgi:hypothetical protein
VADGTVHCGDSESTQDLVRPPRSQAFQVLHYLMTSPIEPQNKRIATLAKTMLVCLTEEIEWVRGACLSTNDRINNAGWDTSSRPVKALKEYKAIVTEMDREMVRLGWIPLSNLLSLYKICPVVKIIQLMPGPFHGMNDVTLLQATVELHLAPAVELSPDGLYAKATGIKMDYWWNNIPDPYQQDEASIELSGFPLDTQSASITSFCNNLGFIPTKVILSSSQLSSGLTVTVSASSNDIYHAMTMLKRENFQGYPIIGQPTTQSVEKNFVPNRIVLFSYSFQHGSLDEATIFKKASTFVGVNAVFSLPGMISPNHLLSRGMGAIRLKQSVAAQFLRVLGRQFGSIDSGVKLEIGKVTLEVRLPTRHEEAVWSNVFSHDSTSKPEKKEKLDVDSLLSKFMDTFGLEDRVERGRESVSVANQFGKRIMRSLSPSCSGTTSNVDSDNAGGPLKEYPGLNDGFRRNPDSKKVGRKRAKRDVDEITKLLERLDVEKLDDSEWEDLDS